MSTSLRTKLKARWFRSNSSNDFRPWELHFILHEVIKWNARDSLVLLHRGTPFVAKTWLMPILIFLNHARAYGFKISNLSSQNTNESYSIPWLPRFLISCQQVVLLQGLSYWMRFLQWWHSNFADFTESERLKLLDQPCPTYFQIRRIERFEEMIRAFIH